jgi:23S rRNA (cytosine1962-C5)-methyltransferase
MRLPPLNLRKDQERRLRAGHLWVYSNEVDTDRTPLKDFAPGDPVAIVSHRGKWLANGYVNPRSLICARVLSEDPGQPLDASLLRKRVAASLTLRERLYRHPYYRLVFSESDRLPGLVVDRYGDYLVVQIATAGMERMKTDVVSVLREMLQPRGILLRNDASIRELEGLATGIEIASGEIPEVVSVEEGGCRFELSLREGQKTGWFFDQAANRHRMGRYVAGKRVLDVCSYVGAWGIRAAAAGATAVTCVDTSEQALALARHNAGLNGVDGIVDTLKGDAFDVMRDLRQQGATFDAVLLDPPAFIKRRKDLAEGTLAYRRLNQAALQLLDPDGTLITSSCSHHMDRQRFLQTAQQAARRSGIFLRLLEYGQQAPDHPVHPAINETEYLKTLFVAASAA